MRPLIMVLWVLLLGAFGRAQERTATVTLDDGRVLIGRVVPTDISSLRLQVNGEVVTIPASKIASCHFESVAGSKPASAAPTAAPAVAPAPMGETAAAPQPAPAQPVTAPQEPAKEAPVAVAHPRRHARAGAVEPPTTDGDPNS